MKRLLYIILGWALALPMAAQEEALCIDGTLLFREDFGGNDPNDPAMSMMNVPGMSSQYHNAGPSDPGSGRYTVRKEGWPNGIQWHRQDPDDKTRGYLLEVDGRGGAEPFYSTTIDGLCEGSKLVKDGSLYDIGIKISYVISPYNSSRRKTYPCRCLPHSSKKNARALAYIKKKLYLCSVFQG